MRKFSRVLALACAVLATGLAGCAQLKACCRMCGFGSKTGGLVACWNFDEGAGNMALDQCRHKLNGAIGNATYVKRGDGYALYFNGKNAYVDCHRSKYLNPREALSWEAWVKQEGEFKANLRGILGFSRETNSLHLNPDRQVRFSITDLKNAVWSKPIPMEWNHVVATFDGKMMKVYVNGELSAEGNSSEDHAIESKDFHIGYVGTNTTGDDEGYWQGWIDEVKLYRRALTASEVMAHYEAAKAGFAAPEAAK